ncbi:MAG: SusC/RagA family TonB-linked outer membrane protein [Bacteroidaceae bacterium]|nr:SusC/RagA family TonB-linked outer membrane protein [Bacteroidaceae bacterium]
MMISFIGMRTQEVVIAPDLKVMLKSESELLDEVVVTAMGLKRSEKALGYSATSVKGGEIALKRTSDVMSSLAGKVAGVQISTTSSDPGASNSVIIRGVSSLSGSNQPLYVVDGVPLNNSSVSSGDGLNNGFDFGNGANAVNPDDVENMTILKGAAATALYGSRAAGGVVMITTKSGKKGQGFGIEYNGGLQWTSVLRLPQMQNEFGMGWYGDKTDNENGSWGPRFDGTMQVFGPIYNNSQKLKPYVAMEDNIKDFFDTGLRYSNSVSFNGATDRSDYFVSFSQIEDDGMIPTDADSYTKYTFSARGSHRIKDLTFSSSLNYAFQKNSFATTGQGLSMYNSIMQTPRDISIIGLEDLSDPFNTPGYYYTPYGVTNPYYVLENYQNEYEAERFYGKFQLDYNFLKYFKFTYRFGLDTTTGQSNTGAPNLYALFYADTANGAAMGSSSPFIGETGSVTQQVTRRREINQDLTVTFNMPIADFNINALVGFNGNERKYSYQYSSITDLTIPTWYNLSNTAKAPSTESYEQLRRLMGVYGQVEASWKNLLYLTFSARNDWSSTLPKENRSFFYPGVTASFIFSELLPKETKDIITFGKVRAAWGKTGNDASPYQINAVYAQATASGYWGSYSFPFQSAGYNAYTLGNKLGSNNLSPEMTTETEVGLNMAFFNNRVSFDAAYYNRNTDKQIYSLNMDPASGYTSQVMNLGKVQNRGVELMVNVTPIETRDFKWTLGWNYSKNWSKVVSLPEELGGEAIIYGFSGGTGMYAVVGEPVGVFKAEVPQMTEDGKIVVNSSTGLPEADPDGMKIVGDMNYKYQMGFSTSFSYKGISLSADVDVRKGGLMYSRTKSITYFTGNAMQTAYNDRNAFIVPNSVNAITATDGSISYVENKTPLDNTTIYNFWDGGGLDMGSGYLIDKSYVKLRSVVLSWDVPNNWLKKTFIRGLRLSAYGNNLFVWTPSSNTFVDPETTSFGNDLTGNFGEYSANPSSRRFGFNVMVKF